VILIFIRTISFKLYFSDEATMRYVSGIARDVKHSVRDVFLGTTQVSRWAEPDDLIRTCVCRVDGYWVEIESTKDIDITEGDEICIAGTRAQGSDRLRAVSFKTKHLPKGEGHAPILYTCIAVLFLSLSALIPGSHWVRLNAGLAGWILTVIAMGLGFSFLQTAYTHWVAKRLVLNGFNAPENDNTPQEVEQAPSASVA
jgi:hypothetical protein